MNNKLDIKTILKTIDRKSTRLNSSHSQISYAVFCLKKKQCTSGTVGRFLGDLEQDPVLVMVEAYGCAPPRAGRGGKASLRVQSGIRADARPHVVCD